MIAYAVIAVVLWLPCTWLYWQMHKAEWPPVCHDDTSRAFTLLFGAIIAASWPGWPIAAFVYALTYPLTWLLRRLLP